MTEPAGYRVTAYYVCHDWRTSGMVEVIVSDPLPPSQAEAERLTFAAAEAAVLRVQESAAGARIDVQDVTVRPLAALAK